MGTLLDGIPAELRSLQRWVCADESSKRPLLCFGDGFASVTDPGTWGTFEQASRCVRSGAREYAGFVFADDGLVGIDIDGAFGRDGMLSDDALEAVRACASYTEISKSGRGIHIICRGDIPFKGRANRLGWELYKDARYFVLTGRTVAYRGIRDAQVGIDAVIERHFDDGPAEGSGDRGDAIWQPDWRLDGGGRIRVEPIWPDIGAGSRHIGLVSYCGRIWRQGCPPDQMAALAMRQNERHLVPPLPDEEVGQIVASVMRYRR